MVKRKFFPVYLIFSMCISAMSASGQSPDYSKEWASVDNAMNKALPQSALNIVNGIYAAASKSGNEVQVIKCLLYKNQLLEGLQENAAQKMIDSMQVEILSAPQPAKSVMQSITAQYYQNYFDRNRYRLYSSTPTVNFKKEDIATWSKEDFFRKISALYLASIQDERLKKVSLALFDPILQRGNARQLRPTLFDLLAHRALDFFKNPEIAITKAADAFEIADVNALAPASQFASVSFKSADSSSAALIALKIFQELIRFHQDQPSALIDVDLERLEYVNENGTFPDKTWHYLKALKYVYENSNDSLAAQAGYKWAVAKSESLTGEKKAQGMMEIMNVLEKIVSKFPRTSGAINAQNLMEEMKQPQLGIWTENVNIPQKDFRSLIEFKNIAQIFLRIIPLNAALKNQLRTGRYESSKIYEVLAGVKPLKQWKQSLPMLKDYLQHQAEIRVEGLPVGEYLLLASTTQNFSPAQNAIAARQFYVSNLSFVNQGNDYLVLNRTTGVPVNNATVKVWKKTYDMNTRNEKPVLYKTLYTNKQGLFSLDPINGYVLFEIRAGNDFLFLDNEFYSSSYIPNNYSADSALSQQKFDRKYGAVFFFTDRKIYRPGQTVYFKAIGITQNRKNKDPKLLDYPKPVFVNLFNANGEKVDSLKLTFNTYGSVSGKFTLPQNQLNGNFTLSVNDFPNGIGRFSVEEYKRPKFFAEFEKIQGNYRLNDTLSIGGIATAYAGNAVDGARVSYRVTRIVRFIYPWLWGRRPMPNSSQQEIVSGETVTDANGKFRINFNTLPDNSIDPKTDPVFDYRVSADITDINGETRSAEMVISAGYKALNLQLQLADKQIFQSRQVKKILATAQNLNGVAQAVAGTLQIYQLQTPQRLLRERLWPAPDTTVMTESEFVKYFPHDVYRNENLPEEWKKEQMVFEKTDSINATGFVLNKELKAGWYLITLTAKDQFGNEVKDARYIGIFDPKANQLAAKTYFFTSGNSQPVKPGDTALIYAGSSDAVFLFNEKRADPYAKRAASALQANKIDNGLRSYSFKIEEKDRGGFSNTFVMVKDNRLYSRSDFIYVPWTNKQLNILFDTYREKTLPGSQETWKVTIKGDTGEKVAAEMLAGMYDASLDQFKSSEWRPLNPWPINYLAAQWGGNSNFMGAQGMSKEYPISYKSYTPVTYDEILNMGVYTRYFPSPMYSMAKDEDKVFSKVENGISIRGNVAQKKLTAPTAQADSASVAGGEAHEQTASPQAVQVRTDFRETAFFYPELRTDSSGNISFSFTMPEALTTWRLMTLAHTKDLETGFAEKTVITQKDLMVIPNAPRFFREGDSLVFSAKVVNMTDHEISGSAAFHLLNASTLYPVDGWFKNSTPDQSFVLPARQSAAVNYSIVVPKGFNDLVTYRIVAKAGNISDGEEAYIPVVTNQMLVTEALPLPMKRTGTEKFTFEKLLKSGNSPTLSNYGLTVEFTPNPAWYAVQALPYLNEYPYECTEQVFNRYFSNALAMHIANASPRLKAVFDKWRDQGSAALLSNLQKNQELKSILLEETPWVMQAKSEEQQKKNIALLFDLNTMSSQLDHALKTIQDRQTSNGGFPWFTNGPDDRFITQYILADMGHLQALNAWPEKNKNELNSIAAKALKYLDKRIVEDYENLKRDKNFKESADHLSYLAVHYLYTRSFFKGIPIPNETKVAYNFYYNQVKKYWINQNLYARGLAALILFRSGDTKTSSEIVKSLKENAIVNPELGMYWKELTQRSFWWYQAPIETQSLLIEVFTEVAKDAMAVGEMKTWLLKNKQTNNWHTTKATAEAVYALLLQGEDWFTAEKQVQIRLGDMVFDNKNEKQEEGTGYFKRRINGTAVKPAMGNITVTVATEGKKTGEVNPSWGAVYWQYFEDLDKITFAETPLKLSKKLFVQKNSANGPVLVPVNDGDRLQTGDKITVRIELRSDRDMEYVHMKDMRASCMEPVDVISGYHWQGGLGYYQSTKDVSTNFFFNYLPKGTYVFEYSLFVANAGDFSNGITTIQSMYAPEFTAHSEGVRVKVK